MEKLIAVVYIVCLLLPTYQSSSSAPSWCSPCVCSQDTLSCVEKGLSVIHIPSELAHVVSKVIFVGNNITAVRANDLQYVINLERLDLTFNGIRTIDSSAFKTLKKITEIDISFNRIKNINSDTFNFENSLEYLLLEQNLVNDINFISEIRNCNLIEINLSFNNLTHIDAKAFSNCWKLQALQLSGNRIKELSSQAFHSLTELRVINLSGNKLEGLSTGMFTECPNLRTLVLNNNEISMIADGAFTDLIEDNWAVNYNNTSYVCSSTPPHYTHSLLSYVDLSHNDLYGSSFTEIFQHLEHLSHLDLSNNHMRDFSPSLVCLMASNVIVDLEENYLTCDCDVLYKAYLLSKNSNISLYLTCSNYYGSVSWEEMENLNCDDPETRVKFVVIFSLLGLASVVAVTLIFARLHYVRIRNAREISPDL